MRAPTAAAGVPTVSVRPPPYCWVRPATLFCSRLSNAGHRRFCNSPNLQFTAATIPRDGKKDHLAGVHKEHIESVVRILEQAKTAAARWKVIHSDFLTPPAVEDALKVLTCLSDVGAIVSGGYSQAERCRISLGHREMFPLSLEKDNVGYPGALAAVSILGDFMVDPAMHGDFLGAILGTGIAREKVGDILVQGDTGAQAIIVPELSDFLESSLLQPRCALCLSVSIHVPLSSLDGLVGCKMHIVKSVEASLRLDAVGSAGFKISRTKLADLISAGNVRVNWKEVTKNGFLVKSGDIISVNQKGRVEVGEINITRKGKYHVELLRFL